MTDCVTDYVTSCTMKIDHLIADDVCIFVYFLILMWATLCWSWWWLWEIKKTGYLTTLPPCPGQPHWPGSHHWTPSPQSFHLPMCVPTRSPLSWSHHLSAHWGQGDIHEVTCWSSLTQRRRSIVWTWSLWKMELLLLYSRLYRYNERIWITGFSYEQSSFWSVEGFDSYWPEEKLERYKCEVTTTHWMVNISASCRTLTKCQKQTKS